MGKLESVFEYNRPEKRRTHLINKWQALKTKFANRYTKMADDNGCNFAGTFADDSIDLNSINTSRDMHRVEAAFSTWGQAFTYDCTKEERNTHTKWFFRNMKHVRRVASLTRSKLDCLSKPT